MRAYRAADVTGDGFVGRREFRLLLEYLVYFVDLWHKFDELDTSHDGRIELEEMKHGCGMLGLNLSDAEVRLLGSQSSRLVQTCIHQLL